MIKRISWAKSISELGNSLRYFTIPLAIISIKNSAQDLALAEFIEMLGMFLAGLVIPLFIDQINKAKGLYITEFLCLCISGLLFYSISNKDLYLIYFACLLTTFVDTFHHSLIAALIADNPETNNDGHQESTILGFSRLQLYLISAGLIGSLAGVELVKFLNLKYLILIDAVTFLISGLLINLAIPKVELKNAGRKVHDLNLKNEIKKLTSEWSEGLNELIKRPAVFKAVLSQSFFGIGFGMSSAIKMGHMKNKLNVPDHFIPVYQTNNRVWMFIGSLCHYKFKLNEVRSMILGSALLVLGYFCLGFTPFYVFLFFNGIQQLGTAILSPANRSFIVRNVPTELRGRVSAIRILFIDFGTMIGGLLSIFLLNYFTTSIIFIILTLFLLVTFFINYHLCRKQNHLFEE